MVIGVEVLRRKLRSTCFQSTIPEKRCAGIGQAEGSLYQPSSCSSKISPVTKSSDGSLWLVSGYGVSVIDPRHLPVNKLPRAGHPGLPGMRERANRFGGNWEFWSDVGAGTEAVLTVPAAYGASNGGPFSFLRRKKAGS